MYDNAPGGNPNYPGYLSGFSGGQFSWTACSDASDGNAPVCPAEKAVLVKFDLYDNDPGTSGANITGLYTDGEYPQMPQNAQYDMSGSGIDMQLGHLMSCTLAYNGTTLTEVVTDTVTHATYTKTYSINIPSTITANSATVGFGGGTGAARADIYINSWTYTVQSVGEAVAPTPTFSPAAGTYSSPQSVAISDAASGAIIYYTTNGSTPSTTSNKYTGAIDVAATETLTAIAMAPGYADSATATAAYTMSSKPVTATPTLSPAGGTYTSAQSVKIADSTAGATVYYTTSGSTPSTSSTKYTGPITVSSTETLQAIAVASDATESQVAFAAYTIGSQPKTTWTPIDYANGFGGSPGGVEPINTSFYSDSSIQLTSDKQQEASNAYFRYPVNVQHFSTTFTWTAKCPSGGSSCGDGLGFVIISQQNPYSPGFWSGSSGGQFSWSSGCTIPSTGDTNCKHINSILVKFDLYDNKTSSSGANLTGLYSGGEFPQPPNPEYDMSPAGIKMQSGHLMRATLSYNGTTLYEIVTDTVTNATFTHSYTVNIPSLVGGNTAIVGFAGGTGAASVQQNIESWTYTVQ